MSRLELGKEWWKSRTLWVNAIAFGAVIVQLFTGFVIAPEGQLAILTVVNILLRIITRSELVWKSNATG